MPTLRKLFDRLFAKLPQALHKIILKSYANMPQLTLRSNFRCYPQVFYSPLVNPSEIKTNLLDKKRELPGITFSLELIFRFIEKLRNYSTELNWMSRNQEGQVTWHETYTTFDSSILYCALRHLKPKRFIEVGCGSSSVVSSEAIRKNRAEGHQCDVTFIEPYPGPRLSGVNLAGELMVKRIEDVPLDYFETLSENDILFIDTSHVIKCQNDVEYELLHILPSLKSGVYIHIHDIYTPYDQPEDWLLGRYAPGGSNEQYAVECLLSGGGNYEIVAPLFMLGKDYFGEVKEFLGKTRDRGQAFWIRKK